MRQLICCTKHSNVVAATLTSAAEPELIFKFAGTVSNRKNSKRIANQNFLKGYFNTATAKGMTDIKFIKNINLFQGQQTRISSYQTSRFRPKNVKCSRLFSSQFRNSRWFVSYLLTALRSTGQLS